MRRRERLAYFLDRFPDEPVELVPGRTHVIGRGQGSEVFVPDAGVSRSHAAVRWEGGSPVIVDLASANGTFVNGERVVKSELRPGDEIRVGGRSLSVRVEDSSTIGRDYRRRRREMRELNTAVSYVPAEGGLAGAVTDVPLAEVVQVLDRGRKTGRLYASFAGSHGHIAFRDGRVVAAAWIPAVGEGLADHEAAYAILALADGVYEFAAEEVGAEQRMDASAQALLLESMRRLDEGRRDEVGRRDFAGDGAPAGSEDASPDETRLIPPPRR